MGAMRARLEVHTLKAALLFAVCNRHDRIEEDDLETALSLGEYLAETADLLADLKYGADLKRLEDRVLRALAVQSGKFMSVSELHKKLGGKTHASDLHRLVESLVAIGTVVVPAGADLDRPKAIMLPEGSVP